MGVLKNIVENTKAEVEKDVTAVAAVGVLGLIGAAVETVGVAGNAVAKSVEKAMEKHNIASLKKDSRKDDYCLFVNKETKIGEGIYNITDKDKEQKYNTLIEGSTSGNFIIRLFSKGKGEIGDIGRNIVVEKRLLLSDLVKVFYILHSEVFTSGTIIESYEGDKKTYYTDFNDWMIIGDFAKGNYKIFDSVTGQTVASVSKKYKKASTYMLDCEDDEYEPVIILITILLDIIE